jgi:hypothetical protein
MIMKITPTTTTAPPVTAAFAAGPDPGRRAEIRGRSAGARVMAFFGLGWTACGISSLPPPGGIAVFAAAATASTAVTAIAVRASRNARDLPADASPSDTAASPSVADSPEFADDSDAADRQRTTRTFGLVVLAEWIAVFAIVRVLAATGHPHAVPAAIAAGVGLHFFPLARLFSVRAYHLTGSALCITALTTFALAPLTGAASLWTFLPGFGSAVTLYATSAHLLRTL